MARRRRSIRLSFVTEAFLRIAGTIGLETLAFVVWNVGTRSPLALVDDIRAAARSRRKVVVGVVRAFIGAVFLAAAIVLLYPALVDPFVDFLPAALTTLLVALLIEHLIGNDVRSTIASRD